MKSVELKEVENAGNRDPMNRRYFADGKRISRDEFDSIKVRAVRLECFSNSSDGGVQTFYCTARLNS